MANVGQAVFRKGLDFCFLCGSFQCGHYHFNIEFVVKDGQQAQAGCGVAAYPEIGVGQIVEALSLHPAPIRIVVSGAPEGLANLLGVGR